MTLGSWDRQSYGQQRSTPFTSVSYLQHTRDGDPVQDEIILEAWSNVVAHWTAAVRFWERQLLTKTLRAWRTHKDLARRQCASAVPTNALAVRAAFRLVAALPPHTYQWTGGRGDGEAPGYVRGTLELPSTQVALLQHGAGVHDAHLLARAFTHWKGQLSGRSPVPRAPTPPPSAPSPSLPPTPHTTHPPHTPRPKRRLKAHQALHAWVCWTRRRKRLHSLLTRHHLTTTRKVCGRALWTLRHSARRRMQVNRLGRRLVQVGKRRWWQRWREAAEAQGARRHYSTTLQDKAFHALRSVVGRRQAARHTLAQVRLKAITRVCLCALREHATQVQAATTIQARVRGVLARAQAAHRHWCVVKEPRLLEVAHYYHLQRLGREVMWAWLGAARQQRQSRLSALTALTHTHQHATLRHCSGGLCLDGGCRAAWWVWCVGVGQARHEEALISTAQHHHTTHTLATALHRWHAGRCYRALRAQQGQVGEWHCQGYHITRAWQQWLYTHRIAVVLCEARCYHSYTTSRRALQAWGRFVSQRRRERARLRQYVQRWLYWAQQTQTRRLYVQVAQRACGGPLDRRTACQLGVASRVSLWVQQWRGHKMRQSVHKARALQRLQAADTHRHCTHRERGLYGLALTVVRHRKERVAFQEAQTRSHEHALTQALHRWRAWRDRRLTQTSLRHKAQEARLVHVRRGLSKALAALRHHTAHTTRQRTVEARCSGWVMLTWLRRWARHTTHTVVVRARLQERQHSTAPRRALHTLQRHAERQLRQREAQDAATAYHHTACARRGLEVWRTTASRQAHSREALTRWRRHVLLWRGLRRWRRGCMSHLTQAMACRLGVLGGSGTALGTALHHWRRQTRLATYLHLLQTHAHAHRLRRLKTRGLAGLLKACSHHKKARRALRDAMRWAREAGVSKAWRQWRADLTHSSHRQARQHTLQADAHRHRQARAWTALTQALARGRRLRHAFLVVQCRREVLTLHHTLHQWAYAAHTHHSYLQVGLQHVDLLRRQVLRDWHTRTRLKQWERHMAARRARHALRRWRHKAFLTQYRRLQEEEAAQHYHRYSQDTTLRRWVWWVSLVVLLRACTWHRLAQKGITGLRRAVGQARAQQEAVHSTRRLLVHAWRRWQRLVTRRQPLRTAFTGWAAYVLEKREAAIALRRDRRDVMRTRHLPPPQHP